MKRLFFTAFLLLIAGTSQASLETDIRRLKEIAEVGANGGEATLVKYDIKTFNYSKEVKKVRSEANDDSGCGYAAIAGRKDLILSLGNTLIFRNSIDEADEILNRLHKSKEMRAAVGWYWPGEEGDSEYCSRELIELYFSNGEALYLSHDSTT